MSGLASDEVAEDYKNNLEDLTTNDRFQISNLTVIAKENTEHAMAISRVLENHIRTTPPSQKLPALYVVDSIVKNVGTPYTLFLGRNMYQTFMNAYSLVDQQTRRKLDEMLRTWKEPVPGSLDTRPVFSPEITRNIENALIKARTAILENQKVRQPDIRGRSSATPTRWNSTPPHGMRPNHPVAGNGVGFNTPRLKALLDLQRILQSQQLPPDQLKTVRDQLAAYGVPQAPVQEHSAPLPAPPVPVATPPTLPPSQPVQHMLNPDILAGLLKATAGNQQPTPPPQFAPGTFNIPPMPITSTPQPAENPLIAALRARGLLPSASAPPSLASGTPITGGSLPFMIPGQAQPTPPSATPQVSLPSSSTVPMTTASMKIPRITLVVSLYEAKSNKCSTCGRRFPTTEEGREKKARHLDWHFKTNQRMADAAKRAQTRSCDDQNPDDTEATAEGTAGADGSSKQGPPKPWIRAPNEATLRNTPCPICQEKFESTWSEDVQDWIWQDAAKVGNRVYHASCYAEVTKDGPAPRASTPQARTGTPDSVLGKRKAEGDSPGQKVRVKTEQ
ncbi:uncharacterized protein N7477_009267 [Penicillium maclennaniae]|uniref:uncharacterized protein n=1 Tax=Penicillium maclennaniae TaxID=1343394 RepID=UPI002540C6E2|nr:uncharacterized protein N7477_009267 [Penicillium maclennaniae]KAJ5661651.1 hypothetical protein N7477_009267 [Penicillium maclennaniae]